MKQIRLLTTTICLLLLSLTAFPTAFAQRMGVGQGDTLIPVLPGLKDKNPPPILVPPFKMKANMSVMLVIGTGDSMRDKVSNVQAAAKAFLDKLNQKTNVGLVLYNQMPYETIPPGQVRLSLEEKIKSAKIGGGNCWGDATLNAVKMLGNVKPAGRRVVVVITDRSDTGSKTTPDAIIKLATKNRVRIWAVQVGAGGQGLPLRVAITLDSSRSTWQFRDVIRAGALQFVQQMPAGMADATVITFDNEILKPPKLLGRFTNNKFLLNQTISVGLDRKVGNTKIWSGTGEAIDTLVRARTPGLRCRECVVLFTDGHPVGEKKRAFPATVEKAVAAKIPVHVLLYSKQAKQKPKKKKKIQPMRKIPKQVAQITQQTGGSAQRVAGQQGIAAAFINLGKKLRPQFVPLPFLQRVARQTEGIYGPVPDPQDLPAGLQWVAGRFK